MNNRLRELRKLLGMTQTEFGTKIHKTMQAVQYYESGKRNINDSMVLLICKTFNVSEKWLRRGIGNVYEENNTNIIQDTTSRYITNNIEEITVPYHSYIKAAAGSGVDVFDEQIDDVFGMPKKMFNNKQLGNIHCIRAYGASMSPRINDGDFIFVDINNNNLNTEGIYVLRIDNTLLIKYIQWTPDGLRLISENKDYEPVLISPDKFENNSVSIIGKVVGVFSNYC